MEDYCDLLMVEHEGCIYLVEAPPAVAVAGSLILIEVKRRSEMPPERIIGCVVDKAFCNRESDAYRVFKQMCLVYSAEKIYGLSWSAETEKSQAPGTDEERSVSNE